MEQPILRRSREQKLRKLGLLPAGWVDFRPARTYATYLHDVQGMSQEQIATLSGVSQGCISDLLRGHRSDKARSPLKVIRYDIAEAVLGVKPAPRPLNDRGARFSALGAQRRMQALICVGFSYQFQAQHLGYKRETTRNYGTALMKNRYIHKDLHDRIDSMYKKLRYEDPMMWGVGLNALSRVQGDGRRKGFAPPGCWDDDAIDRADASPDWTGACGSMEGLRIHRREDVPVCEPCQEARRVEKVEREARS